MRFDRAHLARLCQAAAADPDLSALERELEQQILHLEEEPLLPVQKSHLRAAAARALETLEGRRRSPSDFSRTLRRLARTPELPTADTLNALDDWLGVLSEQEGELPGEVSGPLCDLIQRMLDQLADTPARELADTPARDQPQVLDIRRPSKQPDWIRRVLRSPSAPVSQDFLGAVRRFWATFPTDDCGATIKEVELSVERLAPFVETSPDAEWTYGVAVYAARLVQALPLDSSRREDLKAGINDVVPAIRERRTEESAPQALADRMAKCLSHYESRIDAMISAKRRFNQSESYVLQVNLFRSHDILESGRLPDDDNEDCRGRLEIVESRFDSVRYMSSTSVYLMDFAPELERLEDEVPSALDFRRFKERLKRLSAESRRLKNSGRPGVNKLTKYHADQIQQQVNRIWKGLDERSNSPDELLAAVEHVQQRVNALESKPVLTRRSIRRTQGALDSVARWARHLLTAAQAGRVDNMDASVLTQALDDIDSGFDITQRLWEEIDQRYQEYVERLQGELRELRSQVDSEDDLRSLFDEIRGFRDTIEDRDTPLRRGDVQSLKRTLGSVWSAFWRRTCDPNDLRARFDGMDDKIQKCARNIRRVPSFDDLREEARRLGWRVAQIRDGSVRAPLEREVRKTFGRIKGLERARQEYLEERARNRQALADELADLIRDACGHAEAEPGDPAAWQGLVDANRELLDTRELRGSREFDELKALLDAGFESIREARAQFAKAASIIHSQYMEVINGVMVELERTEPPPERGDALDAIEVVKPLRVRLRSENRLLKGHRQEIYDNLRLVSDAIEEIFEQDSKDRQAQLSQIRNRIEAFTKRLSSMASGGAVGQAIQEHKELHRQVKETRLSMEGRARCRELLDLAWTRILETKARFGRERFEPHFVDSTLVELERQGHFAWMDGVPTIA